MTASPKKYVSAGYYESFKLKPNELARLQSNGFSDDEIAYVEERATILKILERDAIARPTPAEVRASLAQGEKALEGLVDWLVHVDSATHDYLADAIRRLSALPTTDLLAHLDRLTSCLELARRQVGDAKPGRISAPGKAGFIRAMRVRFGKRAAYAISAVLQESKDSIRKIEARRNRP